MMLRSSPDLLFTTVYLLWSFIPRWAEGETALGVAYVMLAAACSLATFALKDPGDDRGWPGLGFIVFIELLSSDLI